MTQEGLNAQAHAGARWLADLDHAIHSGDDEGLWELVSRHSDPIDAHKKLATQIARLAYQVAGRVRFSEMFLVPLIEAAGTRLFDDQSIWKKADFCIGEALNGWLSPKTRKTVFGGIRPYDWIGTWKPNVLRSHLNSTVPGAVNKKVSFLTQTADYPEGAPRLGFISMVLTSEQGWPQLPEVNTLRDERFKKVVSLAMQNHPREAAPTVLTPDRLQYAVADGLCLWLRMLHDDVPIRGWMVAPVVVNTDVVKITLAFDNEQVQCTQFTVRKHQIGLDGMNDVLVTLQDLAPTLDSPIDLPPRAENKRTLDLT